MKFKSTIISAFLLGSIFCSTLAGRVSRQQIPDATSSPSTSLSSTTSSDSFRCAPGQLISFELVTGFVLTSDPSMVTMVPGVLQLSDCIERCQRNSTCKSLNFETGLCVLLTTDALSDKSTNALTQSQFPVFTIFAQKICVSDVQSKCSRGWAFERVLGFELKGKERKRVSATPNRLACMQACLDEQDFECRSANYDPETRECSLSDLDRASIVPTHDIKMRTYGPATSGAAVEYIENNCIEEPKKLCDFRPIDGKILKTVDFVYQNVRSVEECREKCLASPYKCHSFDLGDPSQTGSRVCRTSHLDKYSLAHIEEAYLQVPNAVTYELHSCYNVTILCKSREMVAKVKTSKLFDGKIYAKSRPNLCVQDISNSLEFEIGMKYHDVNCDVKETAAGHFSSDIVIQHHDMIVTTKDLGLSIHCKYDLSNRSITNNVNLAVDGDVDATDSQSAIVSSPNVTMRITDRVGASILSAQVGDPLMIRFEIAEINSPYEIFVRELVAVDGQDQSEIMLIDANGCPTDVAIMGALNKIGGERKAIEGPFDAFKFPTSETVQFRALVTPCLPTCEPVKCNVRSFDGAQREMDSFGRRRRRRSITGGEDGEEIMVANAIQIKDKFEFNGKKNGKNNNSELQRDSRRYDELNGSCMNSVGVIFAGACFLLAQLVLLLTWACLRRSSFTSPKSPIDLLDRKLSIRPTFGLPRASSHAPNGYDMFYPPIKH